MTARAYGLDSQIAKNFRRALWARWGPGVPCWFCGHHIRSGLGEIEHRISPRLRPDLAFTTWWRGEPFLVPVHGGGRRRCPEPGCDLDCNAIAGGNAAPRDELGRSARWSETFLAGRQAERAAHVARTGRRASPRRGLPGKPAAEPQRQPARVPARPRADVGRAWLRSATPGKSGEISRYRYFP
jgi:hypothetical protein